MLKFVEHLSKKKFKPSDLDAATAFFFKYYVHPNFQNGFMQYVMDHSVEFYDYLSQLNPGKAPQKLPQEQIAKLQRIPAKQFLSGKGQADPCPICLQDFTEKDKLIRLPCKHVFHQEQIKEWLRTNKKCPMCHK